MSKKSKVSHDQRRQFIKKAGVSLGSIMVIPSHVLFSKKEVRDVSGKVLKKAVVAPNDKVNLACCRVACLLHSRAFGW